MSGNIPYDPCGHTKIAVSNFRKSYKFYKALFEELGYKQVSDKEDHAGWASQDGYGIIISRAAIPKYRYKFDAPGLHHLCLKARSVKQVNQIYKSLLKKRVYIFDAAQKCPQYTKKYYAVYFADPDGIKLEVAYY